MAAVTAKSRTRCSPELSRGRFRTLFFGVLFVAAALLGDAGAALAAAAGVALAVYSVSIARGRGHMLAYTFVTCDWLLFGLALALSGGTHSWLLLAAPLLVLAELLPAERRDWPYLMGPALLCAIVLAIADPTLGGSRALGLGRLALAVAVGFAASVKIKSKPVRKGAVATIDRTTGFYSRARLRSMVDGALAEAAGGHEPLAVACVRLDHFGDTRDFLGEDEAEALVGTVARRLKRQCADDDVGFRLGRDTLLVALPGRDLREARAWAADAAHAIGQQLIDRHRQTVSVGVAAFPPLRSTEELVGEAFEALERSHAPAAETRIVAPVELALAASS